MFEAWRRALVGGIAAGVVAVVSCSDATERPPPPPDCLGPGCTQGVGVSAGVGTGSPSGSGGGAGGAGGGSGMPGAGIVLAGIVQEVTQLDPPAAGSVRSVVGVRAASAAEDADEPVDDETDLAGAYRLEDVEAAPAVWVGVGTFEDGPVDSFYMDTLQPVDPTESPDDLVVVPRSTMQELAATAFSSNPIELDPAAGHLVVRFVDPAGNALSGVVVVNPPVSDTIRVAYDSGVGAYSEMAELTGVRGVAVIMNYPAVRYPGAGLELVASLNDEDYAVSVKVASNSVSVVTAVIDAR